MGDNPAIPRVVCLAQQPHHQLRSNINLHTVERLPSSYSEPLYQVICAMVNWKPQKGQYFAREFGKEYVSKETWRVGTEHRKGLMKWQRNISLHK